MMQLLSKPAWRLRRRPSLPFDAFTIIPLLLLILITQLYSSCIDVSAQTSIQRAQSLLTPAADRSIWTFNPSLSSSSPSSSPSSSSPHFSTFTPPSQSPPPPSSIYTSNFCVATFNGRNQFIDLYSSQQDGGSRSVSQLAGDAWSIASWIYIDSMTTTTSQGKSRILLSRSTSQVWQTNRALVITIAADGHLALSYFNDRNMNTITGYAGWGNTWIPPLRQWFHIGLVYNVSYFTFYIGGYQIGNAYSSVTLGGIFVGNETLSYSKVGMSDMTVFTKDTLPFQGSLYALGFFDFTLSSDDMVALATPQTAQSLIAASTVTYAILSSTPPLPSDTNPLTSILAPWKYYRSTAIPSSTQISFATLTPDPTLIQFFGARNQWSISFYLRFNSLIPAPCTILYMKDGTINTRVFGIYFDTSAIAISYGTLPTLALNLYHIIPSNGGLWLTGQSIQPALTDWVRITITYDGIAFGTPFGQLSAYLNDALISSNTINLTAAGTTKNIYTTMLLGSDGTTTTGIDGSIFGFTMWQGVSLAQSDITLLLVPSIVEYINDAPATIAAGSTMRVTFTATLIQTNSSLIVRGGDGTSSLSVYQLLDFTLQPSYRVEFVIPSARTASTYTITFEAPIPDPTQHLPQSICIEVVDMTATGEGAAPAVMNIDLTVLTVRQLLETADWTLPLTAPFIGNDAGCILAPAPSGIMNESILTCAGGSNDYIDVMNSTQTKVLPWPGIDINPTAFSFAFWLNSNVDVSLGSFPIFYAMNTGSNTIVVNIVILNGYPNIVVRGPTTFYCWTTPNPTVQIFQQQQQWQHLVVTFGSGGCSVFVDGDIGLTSGTQTANWTSAFQMKPIASDQVYLSGYPSVTPFNASYASIHFWNRELSQREITFLAGNKPAALQIPTTRTRRIAVLGLPSASQLLLQSNFFHSFDRAPIETHGYLIPAPSGASGYHVVAFDGTQPYGFDFTATQDVALSYGAAAWRIFPQSDLWAGQDSITFTMWFQSQNILGTIMDEPLLYFGNYDNTIEIRPMEMRIMAKVNQTICLASPIASGVIPQMIPTCASCFTHITALLNMQMRTCSLYLNGRRVATGALNTAAVTPLLKPWTTFWAHTGSGQTTQQPTNPLKGMIAQFGYWKRALTGIEINRLANLPPLNVALPSNQQQTHMTAARTILANADYDFVPIRKYQPIVAASLIDVNQPNGLNVASYLGSNSFTDLNDISAIGTGLSYKFPYLLSSTISLSVWVNLPPRYSASTIAPCIFNTATSGQGEEISLRHIFSPSKPDIEFRITNGALTICHLLLLSSMTGETLSSLPYSQWFHLAATFDTRGVCSLYFNGALAASATGDSNGLGSLNFQTFKPIARASTYLGTCQTSDNDQLIGMLAQFTMWQRALDQAEIAVLYSQPPPSIARLLLPASSLTLLDSASTPPTPISEWLFPPSDIGLTNYNIAVLGGDGGGGGVTFTSTTASPPVNLLRASDNPSTKQTMPLVWGGESFTLTMWLRSTNSTSILSTTDGFRLFECSSDSSFSGNGGGGGENFISIGIGTSWSFYFETSVTLINATSLIVPVTTNRLTAPPLTYPINKIPQEWQHLAIVYDADSQLVMISHNGAIVKTSSWRNSFHPTALRAVRQKCLLGGSRKQPASASFETLDLQIQYFSYHNSALSPSQLVSLYRNRRSSLLPLPSSTEPLTTQQLLLASSLSTFQYLNGIAPSSSPRVPSLNGKILNFKASSNAGLGNFLLLSSSADVQSPPYRTLFPSALSNIRITGLSIAFWIRVPNAWPSTTHVMQWRYDTGAYFLMQIVSMKMQVLMVRDGTTWCSLVFDQSILVDATLFHHYTFVFEPDNSIQFYSDGRFQPQTISNGVCSSLTSNIDSYPTLPWFESPSSEVIFGGSTFVNGASAYGITGDVAMINVFSRALTTSEITILFAIIPDALTSGQIPTTTTGIPSNSRDSARYSWRFTLAPSRSSSTDMTLDSAPSGVGSVGRMIGSKGQYLSLSDSSQPYYRELFSLQSGNYEFGISIWMKLSSLNTTGTINANNSVIVEFRNAIVSQFRVRLSILSEDVPTRVGPRLALLVTDGTDTPLYQLVTQSNTLRANEWTHIVFAHTSIAADSPYRAVIYVNSALCAAQVMSDTLPSAARVGHFGYDRAIDHATLDAQVAEVSIWQLFDDPSKMLFIPEVILDLYRTPPPQLAGALGSEIDRLFKSAVAHYDCTQPISSSLSTSWLVYSSWIVTPTISSCYFGFGVNQSAPFLDLMNPFDNRLGPLLPPTLTTSAQIAGAMSSTRGLSFSIHFRLMQYPQTKMFILSIGTKDSLNGLIQLTFTSQQNVQHVFSFMVYDAQGTLIVTGTAFVPWNQLPLNVNLHLAVLFGTSDFAMYVNAIQMSTSVNGTLIPAISRPFAAFGRDVYNMTDTNFRGSLAFFTVFTRSISLDEVNQLAAYVPPAFVVSSTLTSVVDRTSSTQFAGWNQSVQVATNVPLTCNARRPVQTQIVLTSPQTNVDTQCYVPQTVSTVNTTTATCYSPIEIITPQVTTQLYTSSALDFSSANTLLFSSPSPAIQNTWFSIITSLVILPAAFPGEDLIPTATVTISPPLQPSIYFYTVTFSSYTTIAHFNYFASISVDTLSPIYSSLLLTNTGTTANPFGIVTNRQGTYYFQVINPAPPILTLKVTDIAPPTQSTFAFVSGKLFSPATSLYGLLVSQLTNSVSLTITSPPNTKVILWTSLNPTLLNSTSLQTSYTLRVTRRGTTTIYIQTEPFLLQYQILISATLPTPTPFISTLTVKMKKPKFPDYLPQMKPAAFDLGAPSYALNSPSSAYTSVSLHFNILPGDRITFKITNLQSQTAILSYPKTDLTLALTGSILYDRWNNITIKSEYEGVFTLTYQNPPFALMLMSVDSFDYSIEFTIPLPSIVLTPVFSSDVFDYTIRTFDIANKVTFAFYTSVPVTLYLNSTLPSVVPSGSVILGWAISYGKTLVTIQTQDGNYTVTVDATASSQVAIPFTKVALFEQLPVTFVMYPPLSLSTVFAYTAYGPTHVDLVPSSIQIVCVSPCPSVLFVNGVKAKQLVDGENQISLGTLQPGLVKLQLLAPNTPPYYQNYSILYNVAKPLPCLFTTCQNSGTCIDSPSTTYNTTYTCYCSAVYEGALCEKVSTTPYVPTYPTAVIFVSGTTIADCLNLTLDGTDSYGLGPAVLNPYYVWSLTSMKVAGIELINSDDPSYNATIAASTFLSLDPSMLSPLYILPATSSITLSGTQFMSDSVYTFGLRVGNMRETSPLTSVTVSKPLIPSFVWFPGVGIRLPSRITRPNLVVATMVLTPSCMPIPVNVTGFLYYWQINLVNKTATAPLFLPDVKSLPPYATLVQAATPNSLAIPANFFRVGYVYRIALTLSFLWQLQGTQSSYPMAAASIALPIIPVASLITAKIFGSDRSRPIDTPFTITADQSFDPDYVNDDAPINAPSYSGLTFMWSCKVISSGTMCTLPNGVDLTQVRIDVPANVMQAGVTYLWTVTVTSIIDSSRSASASIKVTGTVSSPNAKPPLVAIFDAPLRINSDETLRLLASVVTQTTTSPLDMLFSWSIACISSSTTPVTTLPSLYDSMNLGSPVNSSSLVLLPNLLPFPGVYQFSILVTDPFTIVNTANIQTPVSSFTSVTIIVNARPQAGDCTITPSSGIALMTIFTLECNDWFEPLNANFAPFTYAVSYRDITTMNAAGSTTTYVYQQLTAASLSSQKSFLLPAGSLSLRTQVTDQVGATSNFDLLVEVISPTSSDFDFLAYIANLTYVQLPVIMSAGDSIASIAFIRQIADLVNRARTMSQYADDAMSQSKLLQFNIDLVSQHQIALMSVLQTVQSSLDTSTLNVITQSLVPLAKYAQQLPSAIITNLTNEVAFTLGSALSSNRIEPTSAVVDLTQVISNLMTDCSQLDAVTVLAHESMRLRQIHAVVGESIELAAVNYYAYVERTLVAAGTEVHLPTGESVILTPTAMKNYILRLNQLNITTIDTGGATGAAEMDTRIVTFSSRWSSCRVPPGGVPSLSALTNIEITFPNGDLVDIPSLDTDIVFTIPISKNSTDSILDNARSSLPCPEAPFDRETVANTSFTCQFWNVTTKSYSALGCHSMGVTFLADGSTLLQCACSHLTEFAILYAEAQNQYNTDVCAIVYSNLGDPVYLAFLIIYCFVGLIALIQLIRMFRNHGLHHFIFITLEHALIVAICIFRALNMAMYYTLYKDITISKQIILSSLPYLFYSWIFTLVITTWATIWYRSSRGERTTSPLESFKVEFLIVNVFITCAFLVIFGLMSQSTELHELRVLNRAGVALTCIVEMGFGIFLVIYGLLLVRALTEHFVSDYAKKLGAIAISFSIAFGISAAILAYSVAEEDAFSRHSLEYNSIYFVLDIVGLLLVMFLFVNSVSSESDGGSQKSGSTHGSTNGSHTATSARSHHASRSNGPPSHHSPPGPSGTQHQQNGNGHSNGTNSHYGHSHSEIQLVQTSTSRVTEQQSSLASPSGSANQISSSSRPPPPSQQRIESPQFFFGVPPSTETESSITSPSGSVNQQSSSSRPPPPIPPKRIQPPPQQFFFGIPPSPEDEDESLASPSDSPPAMQPRTIGVPSDLNSEEQQHHQQQQQIDMNDIQTEQ